MSKRPASSSEEQASTAKPAMAAEEEEIRPSTSSGTAQSHGVRSGETFLRQVIQARGEEAQLAYEKVNKDGLVSVYHGRIMLIGQDRAGKTSLKKSLIGLPFDPMEQSTDGIEVDPSSFQVDVNQVRNWQSIDEGLLGCSKQVARMVVEQLHNDSDESDIEQEESIYSFDLWDFAGQHLYYAFHPIFFSLRTIYVLVYNLSYPLNATVQPTVRQGIRDELLKNSNDETNVDNLISWLATVHSITQMRGERVDSVEERRPYLRPPIIIVGTCADKPYEDITSITTQIRTRISGKEYGFNVVRPIFSIDNTAGSSDSEIQALRDKIVEVLRHEPYMGEKIPVRWLNFEKIIDALVAENIHHIDIEKLQFYAKDVCLIEDEKEFTTMVNFYHDLGIVIKHRSTVILKAQWLIDLFRQLIAIPRFDDMDPLDLHHWKKVHDCGVLSMELVDRVFAKFLLQGVRDDILNMMEQFGLIAKFSHSATDVKFFVPAQLKAAPDSICAVMPSSSDPCPLYISFFDGFVPYGLFIQLVSHFIRWCSKAGPKRHPKLYRNGALFIIGRQVVHDCILTCKEQFIKVVLKQRSQSRLVLGDRSTDHEVAGQVRIFLDATLRSLSRDHPYLRGLQYQFRVECPYCGLKSKKCTYHNEVSCAHEDCLHLLDIMQENPLFCFETLCDEELKVDGMEKWFSLRTNQSRIPMEIKARGPKAQLAYKNALKTGKVKVFRTRIMFIGQERAGKTSLKKSFLGLSFDPEEESTDGIDVDPSKFEYKVDQVKNWQRTDEKLGVSQFLNYLARQVAEELEKAETKMDPQVKRPQDQPSLKENEGNLRKMEEDIADEPKDIGTKMNQVPVGKEITEKPLGARDGRQFRHMTGHSGNANRKPDIPQLMFDPTLPPDEFTYVLVQHLESLNLPTDATAMKHHMTLDLWDFAGQQLYYASYPVFLSPRAVYLLIYDLSKGLKETAQPSVRQGINNIPLSNPNHETNLEMLLSWLISVSTVCSSNREADENKPKDLQYLRPPVFIVGTHADNPHENINEMELQIKKEISGKKFQDHVIRPYFSVDNTQGSSGEGFDVLRKRMIEVLKEEPYMGEEIPLRWLNFEKVIDALISKKIYYLDMGQLQIVARDKCFVADEEEFNHMVNFYHDLGIIIKHRSTVILKAQWLIELFRQLITIPRDDSNSGRVSVVGNYWKDVQDTGFLSMELINHVFKKFVLQGVVKDDILNMMEHFDLIAKFAPSKSDVKYFVPAQLQASPDKLCVVEPSGSDPCPLYVHFCAGCVPHGLFTKVVSRSICWLSDMIACAQTSPMCTPHQKGTKTGSTPCFTLYRNGAWFIIGNKIAHNFILICKKRFIKIVLKQRNKEPLGDNSAEIAAQVWMFLEQTFHDLSQNLLYLRGLRYQFCVACPYCQQDKKQCKNHREMSCTHEDCLHLLEINRGEALKCTESVFFDELTVDGMEKWFSQRTSQALDDTFYPLEKQPVTFGHTICYLQQMQADANNVTSKTDLSVKLKTIASDKGFVVSDNRGSGNCMFYALSEQLAVVKGIRLSHEELRQSIVEYLKDDHTLPNGTELFNFVDGYSSWDAYLTNMAADGTWGDHVILHGAANCFKTNIHVISSLSHQHDLIISPGCDVDSSNRLVLGHVHELHYVSLIEPKRGEYKTQRRGEQPPRALAPTSLQNSVPRGKGLKRTKAEKGTTKGEKGDIKRLKRMKVVNSDSEVEGEIETTTNKRRLKGLKRMKVVNSDSEVEGEIETTTNKRRLKGLRRMKVVKGDSEVEGEIETKAKKRRPKGFKRIKAKKSESKGEKGNMKRLKRVKVVKRDSKVEGEIKTKAKKRRLKGLKRMKVVNRDSEVEGEIETATKKRRLKVKDGIPSDVELEGLSKRIERWKSLGRRLKFDKAVLTGFHKDNEEWSEKVYAMLMAWKEREGVAATYQVLHDALCHDLVNRLDLAQQVCCHYQTRRKRSSSRPSYTEKCVEKSP